LRAGTVISVFAFVLLGCGDLIDQWLAGYASASFMLGTLLINAGICLGIFGTIGAIGCVASIRRPSRPAADRLIRAKSQAVSSRVRVHFGRLLPLRRDPSKFWGVRVEP
jgi:hypothetical protein